MRDGSRRDAGGVGRGGGTPPGTPPGTPEDAGEQYRISSSNPSALSVSPAAHGLSAGPATQPARSGPGETSGPHAAGWMRALRPPCSAKLANLPSVSAALSSHLSR